MRKTWTVSRGLIAATQADVEKANAINAMLSEPVGILPKAAGDPIRPFSLGLFNDIKARLKPEFGVTALRRATAFYIFSKRYYFASAQPDSMRHDIDGKPVAPLTAADRAAAQKSFLEVKRRLEQPGGCATVRTRAKGDGDRRRAEAGDLAHRQ
ncbi:ProQ/FINO family protein [Rhizobium sp. SIMBA_035]